MIPLAIPPALTGIGLISVWNHPFSSFIYDSNLMPVLAGLARFTPLAVIIILVQMQRTDKSLIEAARIIQKNRLKTILQIKFPLFLPGIIVTAIVLFILTMSELSATLLIIPPGYQTLSIRIFNFLHYGASAAVAGLCLTVVIITLCTGFIALVIYSLWSKILPSTRIA